MATLAAVKTRLHILSKLVYVLVFVQGIFTAEIIQMTAILRISCGFFLLQFSSLLFLLANILFFILFCFWYLLCFWHVKCYVLWNAPLMASQLSCAYNAYIQVRVKFSRDWVNNLCKLYGVGLGWLVMSWALAVELILSYAGARNSSCVWLCGYAYSYSLLL